MPLHIRAISIFWEALTSPIGKFIMQMTSKVIPRVSVVEDCRLLPKRELKIPGETEWIAHKCTVHDDKIWMCASISSQSDNYAQSCMTLSDGVWEEAPQLQIQHQQVNFQLLRVLLPNFSLKFS